MISVSVLLFLLIITTESSEYFKDIERCSVTEKGEEYIGQISVTKSGKKCQAWNKVLQNREDLKETYFSDKSLIKAQNYCRNPNSHKNGPWCFYGDKIDEWEACDIPMCEDVENCKDTESGEEYDGFTNVTKDGNPCQSWAKQSPHTHRFTESSFPEKDFNKIGNKCRNPDNEKTPWCYTTDSTKRWENCDVPFCTQKLSQTEYFKGQDDLASLGKLVFKYELRYLITNMTVMMDIPSNSWSDDVQKKTSVLGTKYSLRCQGDLNYYEYCQLDQITNTEGRVTLKFICKNPLQSAIIITPLEKVIFKEKWIHGPKYTTDNPLGSDIKRYMKEVNAELGIETVEISIKGNASPFYMLADNVIPYAVTMKDEILMTISRVGLGCIGFMGGEYFIDPEYETKLKIFYSRVYGRSQKKPELITKSYLQRLEALWKNKQSVKGSAIWNAHDTIGKDNIKLLLLMIQNGLNVVIGIKPWAYNHYVEKFEDSEMKQLFLVAGLWPSIDTISGDLRIVKTAENGLLPLIHLFEYAKANRTAAASVSKLIISSLTNIPFKKFSDDSSGIALLSQLKTKMSELYYTHIEIIHSILPCIEKPITDTEERLLIELYNTILLNPLGNVFTAPGINFYPGKINKNGPALESVRIKLNLQFNNENNFVGVFVPASENIVAKIITKKSKKCTLTVNFHLFDVSNWDRWDKWPVINNNYDIESSKTVTFSNPFGGLLSILCDTKDDNVELHLVNVVRVAIYDRRNGPVDSSWHELKRRDVPSAILASDTLVFIVPRIAIRNMEDPQPIMELWDKMIKEEYHLRGRSVAGTYREIISTDFQIKAGYMHAGYPIGTFIHYVTNPMRRDKYLFAGEKIKKEGSWGVIHEVGHNLQHRLFTFTGTVDVTNNVFSLVATETVTGQSSWNDTDGWITDDKLPDLLKHINTRNFSFWKENPFVGLGTYAQLRAEFGWEFYRQIFRRYDQLILEYGKRSDSLTNDERIQLWIVESSVLVKMNLLPLYDYWAWPITEETKKTLNKYPLFLADDFLAKMTQDKVKEILTKYGGEGIVSRKPTTLPVVIGPLKNDIPVEGQRVIEEIAVLNN